jgi:hypothetical protein
MSDVTDESTPPSAPARFGPWRREVRAFIELLALTGIAVAQPAFDILKKNAEIFVNRSTTRLEVIGLALFFVLVPPIVLWVMEVVVGLVVPAARRWAHAVLAAGVILVIAIEVLKKQTELGEVPLVAVCVPIALLGGWLILRFDGVRLWLRYLSIAPVIFAIMFLFFSPVTTAVFESDPGSAKVTVGNPKRIVTIVLDEFPTESLLDGTGTIDAELYPNFAALAGDATWYRNETTVAPYTEAAVPAILTGDFPTDPSTVNVAASNPDNLFTLLGNTYEMNVHESVTRLCPTGLCGPNQKAAARLHHGFSGLVYDSYKLWKDFASPERQPETITFSGGDILGDRNAQRTGQRFVRSLQRTSKPRLDFLHVLIPHEAWHYLPTGQDYREISAARGLETYKWATDWTALLGRQRHLLQVGATDRLLGKIVAKLKRIDAYDDSLLVVTADHGAAFTQGNPVRGMSERNYPQIVWAPLFIKTPGESEGAVNDSPARTIDILPTIADHVDVKMPWKVDGHSLLKPVPADQPVRVFEWEFSPLKPPPGTKFVTLDGPEGFAAAMQGQASDASGDPAVELYKIGDYAELFGREAQPLEVPVSPAPTGTIENGGRFARVKPKSKRVPWAYVQGTVRGVDQETPLAITVNGVVAGFSATYRDPSSPDRQSFWTLVPPTSFERGRNEVRVYVIRGDPSAPELVAVFPEG